MWSHVDHVMEKGHSHVLDIPGHVDDLALLHQVLGLHLHGHVAFDDPAASQLGGIDDWVTEETLQHVRYL